jgi:hypothetical protein
MSQSWPQIVSRAMRNRQRLKACRFVISPSLREAGPKIVCALCTVGES